MDQELEMQKDTIEISGGRKLYNYRFLLDGEQLPPMRPEDEVQGSDASDRNEG